MFNSKTMYHSLKMIILGVFLYFRVSRNVVCLSTMSVILLASYKHRQTQPKSLKDFGQKERQAEKTGELVKVLNIALGYLKIPSYSIKKRSQLNFFASSTDLLCRSHVIQMRFCKLYLYPYCTGDELPIYITKTFRHFGKAKNHLQLPFLHSRSN